MNTHWAVFRHDPKTGKRKAILNNSNVTNVEAKDVGFEGARVYIKGHKLLASGEYIAHEVMLTRDIIENAARKLGLLPEKEV